MRSRNALETEHSQIALPEMVLGDHGQREIAAVGARNTPYPVEPRDCSVRSASVSRAVRTAPRRDDVGHRDVDVLTLAGAQFLGPRRRNAERGVRTRGQVGDRQPWDLGHVGFVAAD